MPGACHNLRPTLTLLSEMMGGMNKTQPKMFQPMEDQPPSDLPADARLVPWQPGFVPAATVERWQQPGPGSCLAGLPQGSNSKTS
jgi:hypothetical protein